jgi:AcrR family transcriptional regulator
VATRAGVSEKDLYKSFASVEWCYRTAFDAGLQRLSESVGAAAKRQQGWLEQVRSGLVALLGFFDDEPSWARLLLLETPLNGELTCECRRGLHELLAGLLARENDVSDRRAASRGAGSPTLLAALTGELVVGGVLSVIRTELLESGRRKLVELAPSLMAFIVAPYLGQVAARAELEGRPGGAGARVASESELAPARAESEREQAVSRAAELPIRATHRTTLVLRAIAQTPYSNNREVAQAAGLVDEGQTSKLLARLERQGVIENVGVGPARGEPNAWLLTAEGRRVVALLGEGFGTPAARRAGRRINGAA